MRTSRVLLLVLALVAALLVVPVGAAPATAAASTGIGGVVTDTSGRAVAFAHLEVIVGNATVLRELDTDAHGRYAIVLPPGSYELTVGPPEIDPEIDYVAERTGVIRVQRGQWVRLDPVLSDGAVLSGRLVDPQGAAVVGAGVDLEVRGTDGTWTSSGQSPVVGPDGRYAFDRLLPGSYRVTATAEGRVPTTWPDEATPDEGRVVPVAEDTDRVLPDLVLPLPSSVSGRVFRTDDPAAPVSWTLVRLGAPAAPPQPTPVDADGRFTATGLPPGRYVLWFDSEGVREFWRDAPDVRSSTVVTVGREQDVVLGDSALRASRIAGRVLSTSGSPVPRSPVVLRLFSGAAWVRAGEAVTGDDGRYTSPPLPLGRYRVSFTEPATGRETAPVEVALARETTRQVDGRVRDLGMLVGRVTEPDGQPVTEAVAVVYVLHGRQWEPRGPGLDPRPTDADGVYRTSLPDGRYRLGIAPRWGRDPVVFAGGGAEVSTGADLEVRADRVVRNDLVLQRTGSVSGVVTGTDGRPLAGAAVLVRTGARQYYVPQATADADGRYTVEDIYPGTYLLEARAEGRLSEYYPDTPSQVAPGAEALAAPVVVTPRTETGDRDVELARPSTVELTLEPGAGTEVVESEVQPFWRRGGQWVALPAALRDGASSSVGQLPRGTYRIGYVARLADGTFVDVGHGPPGPVPQPDGEEVVVEQEQDVALRRTVDTTGTVSGEVLRADSGTLIVERPVGSGWETVARRALQRLGGGVVAYATPRLPAGRYRLRFEAPDRQPTLETVEVTTSGAVRRDVTMRGVVLSGQAPTQGRRTLVQVLRPDGSVAGSSTSTEGTFAVGALDPGRYTIRFHDLTGAVADYYLGPDDHAATLGSARFVALKDDVWLYVPGTSRPGRVLHGRVRARDDATARYARVDVLTRRAGRWVAAATDAVDPRGYWRVTGIAPGDYRLRYTRFAGVGRSPDVQVDGGCTPGDGRILRVAGPRTQVVDAGTRSLVVPPETLLAVAAAPRIVGSARSGRTLRVTRGTWLPCQVSLRYRWLRDGVPIAGAVRSHYRVTSRDAGHRLVTRVTATPHGPSAAGRPPLSVDTRGTGVVRR
ncbi:carboxypeptidase-like regulatory domain-containing protein [Nocardioides sp.]|uniref:carboxypeptidase-like regulatory domain-containing protein n=1 Tax=Nocardioides sp. TaxID=35761 RepID=UPI0027183495|nr:carboxypeptidase-like regulatory domain-containing protein [Nocardioides sp.]MDO9454649.1 carboxypeptidase-like regulatory domain-containing protein [Nocardioides sp.]